MAEIPRKGKRGLKDHAATSRPDAAPVEKPPAPLLTPDLLYNRERAYALADADEFKCWLLTHIAQQRIPLDSVFVAVTCLTAYVKYFLLARVEWPELYERDAEPDEDWMPTTEAEAVAVGLSIIRPRRRKPPTAALLPGCKGPGNCPNLRPYGQRFCKSCAKKELERIRAAD